MRKKARRAIKMNDVHMFHNLKCISRDGNAMEVVLVDHDYGSMLMVRTF